MIGEKLSDEWLPGAYGNAIMQLAKTVSDRALLVHVFDDEPFLIPKTQDDHIDSALWHVRCFLAPPTLLMQPSIIAKVLIFKMKKHLTFRM